MPAKKKQSSLSKTKSTVTYSQGGSLPKAQLGAAGRVVKKKGKQLWDFFTNWGDDATKTTKKKVNTSKSKTKTKKKVDPKTKKKVDPNAKVRNWKDWGISANTISAVTKGGYDYCKNNKAVCIALGIGTYAAFKPGGGNENETPADKTSDVNVNTSQDLINNTTQPNNKKKITPINTNQEQYTTGGAVYGYQGRKAPGLKTGGGLAKGKNGKWIRS